MRLPLAEFAHRFRGVLAAVLLGSVGVFLFAVWRLSREADNYSCIEDGLYLGGLVASPPPGTRAVLNLCENEDPYRAEFHLHEPISDGEPVPSIAWLRRAVAFVEENHRAGRTTFVHCRNGVRRGGMVVTAYLMLQHEWPLERALEFVRSRRPQVRPTRRSCGGSRSGSAC
jgi:hypothetical protein